MIEPSADIPKECLKEKLELSNLDPPLKEIIKKEKKFILLPLGLRFKKKMLNK